MTMPSTRSSTTKKKRASSRGEEEKGVSASGAEAPAMFDEGAMRQMLVDGSTFEDIAETLKGSDGGPVPLHTIEKYYRTNLDVQKERITRQVETAKVLKEALTSGKSGHAELAEAVLITGLMGVSRRTASLSMQQAIRVRDQQANERLKRQAFQLRLKKFALDQEVLAARLRAEQNKQELVRAKLSHLQRSLERSGKNKALGPEVIRQIHEIYGLVSPGNENEEAHGNA